MYRWEWERYTKLAHEWTQKYALVGTASRLSPMLERKSPTLNRITLRLGRHKSPSLDQDLSATKGNRGRTMLLYERSHSPGADRDTAIPLLPKPRIKMPMSSETKSELNGEIGAEVRRAKERAVKLQSEVAQLETLIRIKQSQLQNAMDLIEQMQSQYIK